MKRPGATATARAANPLTAPRRYERRRLALRKRPAALAAAFKAFGLGDWQPAVLSIQCSQIYEYATVLFTMDNVTSTAIALLWPIEPRTLQTSTCKSSMMSAPVLWEGYAQTATPMRCPMSASTGALINVLQRLALLSINQLSR